MIIILAGRSYSFTERGFREQIREGQREEGNWRGEGDGKR